MPKFGNFVREGRMKSIVTAAQSVGFKDWSEQGRRVRKVFMQQVDPGADSSDKVSLFFFDKNVGKTDADIFAYLGNFKEGQGLWVIKHVLTGWTRKFYELQDAEKVLDRWDEFIEEFANAQPVDINKKGFGLK